MAREDVPPLGPVPKKRRQLEAALDVHVAMWLASDDLTPSERRRLEEEKARRKRRDAIVVMGFTGTRAGMTPKQKATVEALIREYRPAQARHGDCLGADAAFHGLCRPAQVPVILHPAEQGRWRAFCRGALREEKAKPPLERNKDIVRESTVMVATVKETREPENPRGHGTWQAVRYAYDRGVPTRIVLPDGRIVEYAEVAAARARGRLAGAL